MQTYNSGYVSVWLPMEKANAAAFLELRLSCFQQMFWTPFLQPHWEKTFATYWYVWQKVFDWTSSNLLARICRIFDASFCFPKTHPHLSAILNMGLGWVRGVAIFFWWFRRHHLERCLQLTKWQPRGPLHIEERFCATWSRKEAWIIVDFKRFDGSLWFLFSNSLAISAAPSQPTLGHTGWVRGVAIFFWWFRRHHLERCLQLTKWQPRGPLHIEERFCATWSRKEAWIIYIYIWLPARPDFDGCFERVQGIQNWLNVGRQKAADHLSWTIADASGIIKMKYQ